MFLVGVFTGEVGALASVEWLPWLLVGLPAGAWVDRSRKRPLLIACDLARVVLLGSVPTPMPGRGVARNPRGGSRDADDGRGRGSGWTGRLPGAHQLRAPRAGSP